MDNEINALKKRLEQQQKFLVAVASMDLGDVTAYGLRDATVTATAKKMQRCQAMIDAAKLLSIGEEAPLLKLWFIYYNDDDGNDYSMFIRATSAESAAHQFKSYQIDANELEIDDGIFPRPVPGVYGVGGVVRWNEIPTYDERGELV
jgi:hypothetical protein